MSRGSILLEDMESTNGDWRNDAACTKSDPELFFPVSERGNDLEQIEKAKIICFGCLAVDQCLSYALNTNQNSGVWGGKTESERREMKRAAARQRRRSDYSG